MQPYFFPYIGYFQGISAVDKYILYENLDYIKEGWMHRNRILIKNGAPTYIIARVLGKSSNRKISEIELDKEVIWKKKMLNTIFLNYKGSEHFEEIFPLIESLILYPADYLFEYNAHLITRICEFLEIPTEIVTKNPDYLPIEEKLDAIDEGNYSAFPELTLTQPIKKVARVIEMCKAEKADIFINAIGGTELYDKEEFKKYGIDLFFIKTNAVAYRQFSDRFHPYLSIIDVLMHNGKEKTQALLKEFELI